MFNTRSERVGHAGAAAGRVARQEPERLQKCTIGYPFAYSTIGHPFRLLITSYQLSCVCLQASLAVASALDGDDAVIKTRTYDISVCYDLHYSVSGGIAAVLCREMGGGGGSERTGDFFFIVAATSTPSRWCNVR